MMDLKEAQAIQSELASRLILEWDGRKVDLIAGADFGYDDEERKIGACIVVFKRPDYEIVEISEAVREVAFSYIPGFLAFREGPVFLEAFKVLKNKPDITLVDGNGIAHPRKMGLASFVGVKLDICTIGCAKTPFFPFSLPDEKKGAYTFFKNERKEKVGLCLRTRSRVKPIFVSPGHRIDFANSMKFVLSCSRFRVPEPIREAHRRANEIF
jgi:deoxyribonuclease V